MHKRITWMVVLVAFFVLFGGLSFGVGLYFDYLWFVELGKTVVFTTVLYAKSILGSGTMLVAFLFLYLNFLFANRGPGQIEIGIPTPTGQITAYRVEPETVSRFAGLASLAVGFLVGVGYATNWERVWRWIHRVDFGSTDPVFGRPVSFYFFSLPFLRDVVRFGLVLGFLALIGVLVLYYFKGALHWGHLRGNAERSRSSVHVSLLAALVFALLGANAYLDRFELLYGTHDVFSGAGYADLHARLPMLNLLALAALAGALLWVANAFLKGNRAALTAIALYLVVMFGGNLYPAFLQKFVVDPNELDKESPQIVHNIQATLEAYNLDAVEERDLSGDTALTVRDIENNSVTIQSIRLWDHEPLLDALKQIQEIRTYYDFVSVDNDRYQIDGQLKQLMLSARELNSTGLPERNWINEHLSYTHGYGIAVGPVNRMTSEGLPVLHVQNIPPESAYPLLRVDRPEIYYGELTNSYALVNTGQKEFDYPSGEENVYARYQGEGGVRVHSLMRKLLFAFYFRDANIVLSPLVTRDSRFLYHRNIRERIKRVAPFLMLDQDPYMVISDGKLYWIQDAYTVSDRYPYSTRTPGVGNYIRNSVKVVVDAYNGDVDLYVADCDDPVIQVYQKIFPGVFRPLAEIPEELRLHLRYPEDIFTVQTYMYSVYHMGAPQIFYNKEDLWQVPTLATSGTENPMAPYYTIMRLPQEEREEFILMLPFTPGRKDNLSAWMVARSDGEHYGKLVVYRFPKQKLVYGPRQIVARVNQDAEIARQISLWDQRGSQVIQGNLLVIPIEEALLYVRPLYLRAQSGKIPELKRVIVAYENRIAMEETLEDAIARIFEGEYSFVADEARSAGEAAGAPPRASAGRLDLVEAAGEAYRRAVAAQRQGDWAKYGEELRKLGAALEELNQERDGRPAPGP